MDKMDFVIFDHWLRNYKGMVIHSDNEVLSGMYKTDVDYFSEVLSDEWSDNRNSSKENAVDDSWKNAEAVVASSEGNDERRIFLNAEDDNWLTVEDVFYKSDELVDPVVIPDIDFSYEEKTAPRDAMLEDIERYTRVHGQEVDSDDDLFEISRKELKTLFSSLSETFDMFVDLPEFVPFASLVSRYGRAVRSLEWYLFNGSPLNESEVSPIVFTDKGLFVRMYFNKSERVFLPNWIFVSDEDELRERILGTSDGSKESVSGESNE